MKPLIHNDEPFVAAFFRVDDIENAAKNSEVDAEKKLTILPL